MGSNLVVIELLDDTIGMLWLRQLLVLDVTTILKELLLLLVVLDWALTRVLIRWDGDVLTTGSTKRPRSCL